MFIFQNICLINLRHLLTMVEQLIRLIVHSRSILRPPRTSKLLDRSLSPKTRPPQRYLTILSLFFNGFLHLRWPSSALITPPLLRCSSRHSITSPGPTMVLTPMKFVDIHRWVYVSIYLFFVVVNHVVSVLKFVEIVRKKIELVFSLWIVCSCK